MPETFSPIQWVNDTSPALNENNLNRLEHILWSYVLPPGQPEPPR